MRFLWAAAVFVVAAGCFSKPPDNTGTPIDAAPGDGRTDARTDAQTDARIDAPADARIDGPALPACDWMNFDNDLVMHLPFDETSGTVANDLSPNNLDGTLVNANFSPGRRQNAVNLDGNGSRVSAGSASALDNLAQVSACAWTWLDDVPGDNASTIVDKSGNGYVGGWNMYFETSPAFRFGFLTSGGDYVSGTTPWAVGNWMHVCATWNGQLGPQTITLYRNGEIDPHGIELDMDLTARQDDSAHPLVLGRQSNMSSYFLEGKIDEFFLFKRVITPEEVRSLYQCAP